MTARSITELLTMLGPGESVTFRTIEPNGDVQVEIEIDGCDLRVGKVYTFDSRAIISESDSSFAARLHEYFEKVSELYRSHQESVTPAADS